MRNAHKQRRTSHDKQPLVVAQLVAQMHCPPPHGSAHAYHSAPPLHAPTMICIEKNQVRAAFPCLKDTASAHRQITYLLIMYHSNQA